MQREDAVSSMRDYNCEPSRSQMNELDIAVVFLTQQLQFNQDHPCNRVKIDTPFALQHLYTVIQIALGWKKT